MKDLDKEFEELLEEEDYEEIDEEIEDNRETQLPDGKTTSVHLSKGQELMQQVWNIDQSVIRDVKKAATLYSMKHGMFASVPIMCKADKCSYKDVCTVSIYNRTPGQRCPMEAGAILARFDSYCKHFDVGIEDDIKPDEEVDLTLIRELVNIEVMMLRVENKIAIDGDFLGETIAHVSKKDTVYYEDTITPAAEYQERLSDRRQKILRLLNSTRKDKANETSLSDPSVKASILMEKVAKLKAEITSNNDGVLDIIDVDLSADQLLKEDGSINFDIIDSLNEDLKKEGE
jgi:hypothetical protein